jgi:hypothetical protein
MNAGLPTTCCQREIWCVLFVSCSRLLVELLTGDLNLFASDANLLSRLDSLILRSVRGLFRRTG